MKWFLGKRVKKRFPTTDTDGAPTYEHLWVRVTGVIGQRLVGTLESAPGPRSRLKTGARVMLAKTDIEEVLEEAVA